MNTDYLRKLKIRSYSISNVVLGNSIEIVGGELRLSRDLIPSIVKKHSLIEEMRVSVIKPFEHDLQINTILDILPISTKVLGNLGEGISHTLTGVYALLSAKDADGRQIAAFGSSDGVLKNSLKFGKAGTPKADEHIIHIDILLKGGKTFDRSLPNAAAIAADEYLQKIRETLKCLSYKDASEEHEFFDVHKKGAKKILILKLIAGQGACYDNMLFCDEPSGFLGGRSIIDMANMPILLSPNEYRDGAIRAMT